MSVKNAHIFGSVQKCQKYVVKHIIGIIHKFTESWNFK